MELDVLDPRFYDDPWDAYRWLRHESPIHWDSKNELWVFSRHADVSHISRHPDRYSAAHGVRPVVAAPMSLISMDDPEHTRQRRLINKGFTPKRVREISDHIRDLSNQIIDEISAKGECDFVEDFARHVPLIVIAELMGLDPGQRDSLYHWSEAMMAGDGHVDPSDPVLLAAAEAGGAFALMCIELIEQRRGNGDYDDIIGILTRAYDEGALVNESAAAKEASAAVDKMTNDDLILFLILLTVAGNETTRNALSGGLLAFSKFPHERERLIADPSLIDTAVEEIVRYVSPVMSFSRTATEDHTYTSGDVTVDIKAGQKVFMLYQSANRDEDVFDDPDEFRIDRDPNPHLAFGIGTHFCLGANLARAEIKVVFEELFKRLSDIRVPDGTELKRGDSSLVLSLNHLPAVFTPEKVL